MKSAIITLHKGLIRNSHGDFFAFLEQDQEIDLLKLDGGNESILFKAQLPEGDYDHIRLIMATGAGVITFQDNSTAPFTIPSSAQSGLKLFFAPIHIENGIITKLILDIDIGRSFVAQGNGSYHFKPVLHLDTKQYEDNNPIGDVENPEDEPCDDLNNDSVCDDPTGTDPVDPGNSDDPIYYPPVTDPVDPSGIGV